MIKLQRGGQSRTTYKRIIMFVTSEEMKSIINLSLYSALRSQDSRSFVCTAIACNQRQNSFRLIELSRS